MATYSAPNATSRCRVRNGRAEEMWGGQRRTCAVPTIFVADKVVGTLSLCPPYDLFKRRLTRQRQHIVLRAGAAADPDGADHLAVDDQHIAAARRDHVIERREVSEVRPLADQRFEHQRRTAVAGRRA